MSFKNLPELGVGITYSSAIEPLLNQYPTLLEVLEIEPQTSWVETSFGSGVSTISDVVLDHIASLPGRKLVHSVGMPVGTSKRPDPHQLQLLDRTIRALDAPWMSEHLSFNNGHDFFTGFFLPPRQSADGIAAAVRNVQIVQETLSVPVAIETGVNYFQVRADELPDGAFVGRIAEAADCGILLDLHNLWTNQLNGRQSVEEFLQQIPLERVLEIHLAGGLELDGFYLDAHSGAIPNQLLQLTQEVIGSMPNVKAIIFEMFPSFVPVVGLELVKTQIDLVKALWQARPQNTTSQVKSPIQIHPSTKQQITKSINYPSLVEWEQAIGRLVTGQSIDEQNTFKAPLEVEPGITLVRGLIKEFRGSMVVGILKLSSRFLMLALGTEIFRAYLEDFWSKTPPSPMASTEAANFGAYLQAVNLAIPNFNQILEFELAVVATLLDDQTRIITFERNPLPLIQALAQGQLPTIDLEVGIYEIEVTPDGPVSANGVNLRDIQEYFPSH